MGVLGSFIVGLVSGLASSAIVFLMQKDGEVALNLFLVGGYVAFLSIIIFIVYRFYRHESSVVVLKDIVNGLQNPDIAKWDYGKYGFSAAPGNETWQEWIVGLLKTTNRPDLDYYNFGKEYYFFDLSSCKKIKIPTGNDARRIKVGETLRPGMVLRLMSNG